MNKKIKGSRSLDDINAEYSLSCGQLGDYSYRRGMLAREIEKLTKRLGELDLEAAHAKQQMSKLPPATDKNGVFYEECTSAECAAAEAEVPVAAV